MLCYHVVAILDYLRADFVLINKEHDMLALSFNFTFGKQDEIFAKGIEQHSFRILLVCQSKASFIHQSFLCVLRSRLKI